MIDLEIIKKDINKGDVFFISDFTELDNYEAVRKSLQRLTNDKSINRIAKGIYFLPKRHEQLGIIYPHAEKIARAIAKRDNARIIATGSTAMSLLGLTTQIPMKTVFLTDGSPRTVKVGSQTIQFKRTTPRNLSIKHRLTNLIIQALKEIGEKNVSEEVIDKIQKVIDNSGERELVYLNLKNAPVWIQKVILSR